MARVRPLQKRGKLRGASGRRLTGAYMSVATSGFPMALAPRQLKRTSHLHFIHGRMGAGRTNPSRCAPAAAVRLQVSSSSSSQMEPLVLGVAPDARSLLLGTVLALRTI
eukprot:scaffold188_cov429-Prasinococcus_capsulatus_cf.AAC.4